MSPEVLSFFVFVGVVGAMYFLVKKYKSGKDSVLSDRRIRPPRDPNKPPTHEK